MILGRVDSNMVHIGYNSHMSEQRDTNDDVPHLSLLRSAHTNGVTSSHCSSLYANSPCDACDEFAQKDPERQLKT